MAALCNDKNGRRRLIVQVSGKRHTIRLGRMQRRSAEIVRRHVEYLVENRLSNLALPDDTAAWIGTVDGTLRAKLENIGLIGPAAMEREPEPEPTTSLGDFTAEYMGKRIDIKPRTRENLDLCRRRLIEYFGADKDMSTVTPGDCEDFRLHLIGKGNGENTIRRTVGRARQFWRAAIRRKLLTENPWEGMKTAVKGNESRFYFVTTEEAERLIDAAPDCQWRLLIALARWGGVRTPSESLALTWECIDWERDRVKIISPKTEHLDGKGSRWIPMFPELRPYLQESFEAATPGSVYCITRYRDSSANLRTQLGRIARRAKIDLWPKCWQNMRATRQTELCEVFPSHVVAGWMGNSEPVAIKHYLHTTDEHFDQAIRGTKAAREAARGLQETPRNALKQKRRHPFTGAPNSIHFKDLGPTSIHDKMHRLPPRGLEPLLPG